MWGQEGERSKGKRIENNEIEWKWQERCCKDENGGRGRDVARGKKKENGKMFNCRRQASMRATKCNADNTLPQYSVLESNCRCHSPLTTVVMDPLIRGQVPILSKWTAPQPCLWAKQKSLILPAIQLVLLPSYLDPWLYLGSLRNRTKFSRLIELRETMPG